jgi:hypothetical protein
MTHLAAELHVQAAEPNLSTASETVCGGVDAAVVAAQGAAKHEFLFVNSVVSGHGFNNIFVNCTEVNLCVMNTNSGCVIHNARRLNLAFVLPLNLVFVP